MNVGTRSPVTTHRRQTLGLLLAAWPPAALDTALLPPALVPAFEDAADVLAHTNAARAQCGLPSLAWDATLAHAAQEYALVLATDGGVFAHDAGAVPDVVQRVRNAGYQGSVWCLGENLAAGYAGAEAVVNAWWGSPGHRDNLLNPWVTTLGVGVVRGGPGPWDSYWCFLVAGCDRRRVLQLGAEVATCA